jgi:O-antigen ligase
MLAFALRAPSSHWKPDFGTWATEAILRPVQILASAAPPLFLAAFTAMLLRHSETQFYPMDRVAFGLLVLAVVARTLAQRQPLFFERATWPMIVLTLLAAASVAGQPFDAEAWSLLASKFVVPFVLFHLAARVFTEERHFRQFEIYALVVLGYLSFTAIAFLCGQHWLIFPRFILDESLGLHAERARGPFLQAVANGVSLNLLGVLAVHAYRRGSVRGAKIFLLLASVPIAILATMTRAVWLSFAGTVLALTFLWDDRKLRKICVTVTLVAAGGLAIAVGATSLGQKLGERFQDRSPLEFREAVYSGSWEMFLDRPLLGWGFHRMPDELPRHVSGYSGKVFYPHNTYLELLVEQGLLGLVLYLWLMWEMWRLGQGAIPPGEKKGFLDRNFHRLWLILLAVYWVNAAVVVMSYQFVNGVLFTMAGMLAAQRRRAERRNHGHRCLSCQ